MKLHEAIWPEEFADLAGALVNINLEIIRRGGCCADYHVAANLCEDGRTVGLMADLNPDDSNPILASFVLAERISQNDFDRLGIDATLHKNWTERHDANQ